MRTAQESLIFLHELGFSDAKLGKQYGKRREQICKIRHGTEKGSDELRAILHDDCEQALAHQADQVRHTPTHVTHTQQKGAPITVDAVETTAIVPYEPEEITIRVPQPTPLQITTSAKKSNEQAREGFLSALFKEIRAELATYEAKPRRTMDQLKPGRVRVMERRAWKEACKQAKRNGLPLPPRPSQFKEDVAVASLPYPRQATIMPSVGFQTESEYRNCY